MSTNNACDEPTASPGKLLQGQGIAVASNFSVATYPSLATGTGKILRADGTNWVPTTATFPDLSGAANNLLTSDGTNWISAPVTAGSIFSVTGTLTNSQIKNLRTSAVTILAGLGTGKVIVPIFFSIVLNYGGSNPFTNNGAAINLYYSTVVAVKNVFDSSVFSGTVNEFQYHDIDSNNELSITLSSVSNTDVTLFNGTGVDVAGNAANDNTMSYQMLYYILTM
jgi:hypothetical protein